MQHETIHTLTPKAVDDLDLMTDLLQAITRHIRDCGSRPSQVFLSPENLSVLKFMIDPTLKSEGDLKVFDCEVKANVTLPRTHVVCVGPLSTLSYAVYNGVTRDIVVGCSVAALRRAFGSEATILVDNEAIKEGTYDVFPSDTCSVKVTTTDFAETYMRHSRGLSFDDCATLYLKLTEQFGVTERISSWKSSDPDEVAFQLVAHSVAENVGFWIQKLVRSGTDATVRDCVVSLRSKGVRVSTKDGRFSECVYETNPNGIMCAAYTAADGVPTPSLPKEEVNAPLNPSPISVTSLYGQLSDGPAKNFLKVLGRLERRVGVVGDFTARVNAFNSVYTVQFKTKKFEYSITGFNDQVILNVRPNPVGESDWRILLTTGGQAIWTDISEGVMANEISDGRVVYPNRFSVR